jgi:hypothetical protein
MVNFTLMKKTLVKYEGLFLSIFILTKCVKTERVVSLLFVTNVEQIAKGSKKWWLMLRNLGGFRLG